MILDRNTSCEEFTSFLGGGCAHHYVPAICDEITHRSKFLTAYTGEPYEDAGRITNRKRVLVADTLCPDRLAVMKNYCHPAMDLAPVGHDPHTGLIDVAEIASKLSPQTAAVYFENPSYLGFIEDQGQKIADLACGDIQGLGNHMYFGGALGGFIASRDEEKFVMDYPSRLFGIAKTTAEGEWGFGDVAYSRTSFDKREKGKEFVGTAAALHGIGAAVYLSLMGPQGVRDLGRHILQKTQYAMKKLAAIKGVRIRWPRKHGMSQKPLRPRPIAASSTGSTKALSTTRRNGPSPGGLIKKNTGKPPSQGLNLVWEMQKWPSSKKRQSFSRSRERSP